MSSSTILWRRLDRPGHESAYLFFKDSMWHLNGTSVFEHNRKPCRLDYGILCDSKWNTVSARVAGWIEDRVVEIELIVDSEHFWHLNCAEVPQVRNAVDLDLNFSPSTNLLPIRRLNLDVGQETIVKASWLRFPDFNLQPLDQIYRRVSPDTYQYESAGGKFKTELKVNESGFVTEYPDYFALEAFH